MRDLLRWELHWLALVLGPESKTWKCWAVEFIRLKKACGMYFINVASGVVVFTGATGRRLQNMRFEWLFDSEVQSECRTKSTTQTTHTKH